jgi:PAS domain S-box-containing protein
MKWSGLGVHLGRFLPRGIAERKRAEKALRESEERLRLKLDSVTVPGTDIGEPTLGDIIDVSSIQNMVDDFHKLTGMGVWILDLKGTVLVGVGWQDICIKYHRIHPQTVRNCIESDLYLNRNMQSGKYVAYKCKNGMTDVITPLYISGKHVGNIYTGQFFYEDEDVDVEYFAAQATQYGFEREPYLEALRRVPRFDRNSVQTLMDFLVKFTTLVSKMGYNYLQLTKAIGEQKRVEEELRKFREHLEELVKERTEKLELEIIERKRAEDALRESESKFKRLYDSNVIGVIFWDTAGNISQANDEFLRMVGYTEDDVLSGRVRWKDMTPPEYAYLDEKAIKEMTETGISDPFEKEYIRKDGSRVPIRLNAALLKGEKDVGICFIQDISERKRAEERVKHHAFDLLVRNRIAEAFLTVPDEDMYAEVLAIILEAMNSKYGVFGYLDEKGALIVPTMTRTIWDKCQVADKKFVFPREKWGNSSWPRAIREKKTICLNTLSNLIPQGHVPMNRHISMPLIHKNEVVGLIQVANKETDYTQEDIDLLETIGKAIAPVLDARLRQDRYDRERKQANEELKKVVTELERSNKDLEQFAFIASHDLQEPLRMVSSYTQLLAKRYEGQLDKDAHDFIRYAVDGANRMQALIQDLLVYSRITTRGSAFIRLDLHEALGEAVANLQAAIIETSAMVTNSDLPTVNADRTQIVQVFQNLVGNAVKFRKEEEPPRVHIWAEREGSEWIISVKDNGIGIDPQYFGRLFVIFQRLNEKQKYPGTGIGLALCQRIITRHGGRIWVESAPGEGSTFRFTMKA